MQTVILRNPTGTALSSKTATATAQVLLADGLHGDAFAAADPATAQVSASISFDPWGIASGATLPLGFQGGYTDPDTNTVDAHARWYDPATGAFTSRDTWTLNPDPTAQANRYTYANSSPLTATGRSGHILDNSNAGAPGCSLCYYTGPDWHQNGRDDMGTVDIVATGLGTASKLTRTVRRADREGMTAGESAAERGLQTEVKNSEDFLPTVPRSKTVPGAARQAELADEAIDATTTTTVRVDQPPPPIKRQPPRPPRPHHAGKPRAKLRDTAHRTGLPAKLVRRRAHRGTPPGGVSCAQLRPRHACATR